jgi:hypothetical protein
LSARLKANRARNKCNLLAYEIKSDSKYSSASRQDWIRALSMGTLLACQLPER